MIRRLIVVIAAALSFSSLPAAGSCPTLPAQSPIAAPDPSDVPRANNALLYDYQQNWFEGKQNHVMAFVQTGPDEQKVWFTVNSVPHYTTVFYNRRFRTSSTAAWQWAYAKSIAVTSFESPGSAVVNAVLYSPTAKYRAGGATGYKYVMYSTYQPKSCDGAVMGYAMVSFSNDGTCWSAPQPMSDPDGVTSACDPSLGTNLVETESFDVIDAGTMTLLAGMGGHVPTLANTANMDSTQSWWGYSNLPDMRQLYRPPSHVISKNGIVSPEGIQSSTRRYKTYSYLMNPAIAWDDANGDLYLTRAYPYPYDRVGSSHIPSMRQQYPKTSYPNPNLLDENGNVAMQEVAGCFGGPGVFPNRVQVYRMHIGALTYANFAKVSTGTWTLMSDIGNSAGYEWDVTLQNIPIAAPQTSVGRDYGAASFLRDGAGRLQIEGGNAFMFPATQMYASLSIGPCRVTGLERSFLTVVPR